MSSFARRLIGVCASMLAAGAVAAPVVVGDLSGYRGEAVAPAFQDTVAAFESADVSLVYDASVLAFLGAMPGTLTPGALVFAGAPTPTTGTLVEVLISIATAGPVSGFGTVFETAFDVLAAAPIGTTTITFSTLDPAQYDFDPLDGVIEVLAPTGIPAPGSAALASAALLALVAARRRATAAA